jgi:hypothetical protein
MERMPMPQGTLALHGFAASLLLIAAAANAVKDEIVQFVWTPSFAKRQRFGHADRRDA